MKNKNKNKLYQVTLSFLIGIILSFVLSLIFSKINSITKGMPWKINIGGVIALAIIIMMFILKVKFEKIKILGNSENYTKVVIQTIILEIASLIIIIIVSKMIERFIGLKIPLEIVIGK